MPVPQLVVADARAAMGLAADAFFGFPTRELQVGAVTGTNGKTTTAFLLYSVLAEAGLRPGLVGTIESRVGGERREVVHTTPESLDLQRTFREMLDAGDRSCALEASSHGSELRRLVGVRFAALAFTNLSPEHLDLHGTLEAYFDAKRRLFVEPDVDGHRPPAAVNVGRSLGAAARGGVARARRFAADVRSRRGRGARARGARARRLGLAVLRRRAGARDPAARPLQRRERPRGGRAGAAARRRGLGRRARRRRRRGCSRPVRGRGRGPAVHRARGLRAHAGRTRERARRGARARDRAARGRVRLRRRPRPGQAAAHGRRGVRVRRRGHRHVGQSAQRGSGRDHRRGACRDERERVGGARPGGGDRAGPRAGGGRRRGGDRRQGPRAGPGVRRPDDPVRRPRGRARGAAPARRDGRASDQRAKLAQIRHRHVRISSVPSKAGGGWFTPLPGWGARA